VPSVLADPRQCWVDVQGIGDERTLVELQRLFSLHPLALEDAVNSGHRPTSQVYGHHHLIISRAPRLHTKPGVLQYEQVSLFLGERTLLTIQERHGDELHAVVDRLRQANTPIRSSGVDYLAYALLDAVVDQYVPLLEEMGDFLERIEREVLRSHETAVLTEVNRARRELLMTRRALWPQRDMVGGLIRDPSPFLSDSTRVYLRDVLDHCTQLIDVVETYREVASGLMSTYLSTVGNRTNEVMKVLTMISTIFIPLSFVAGIYGMNFQHMPELRSRAGYPIVLGSMAIVALGMMVFFVRRGWIGAGWRRWYLRRRRRSAKA
jgi:magnesium transporter